MSQRHKPGGSRENPLEQAMRDQEVLRANRELSAYFKGRRTEREARAALKIIKAFVRDRERRNAGNRPPLPGAGGAKMSKELPNRKTASASSEWHIGKSGPKSRDKSSKGATAAIEPRVNPDSRQLPKSDERLPE